MSSGAIYARKDILYIKNEKVENFDGYCLIKTGSGSVGHGQDGPLLIKN